MHEIDALLHAYHVHLEFLMINVWICVADKINGRLK